MYIEDFIPVGKDNAIHLHELAKLIGHSEGSVKDLVRRARNNGALICSNTKVGYWIAENNNELREFNNFMSRSAITRFKSSKTMRDKCKQIEGQEELLSDLQGGDNSP